MLNAIKDCMERGPSQRPAESFWDDLSTGGRLASDAGDVLRKEPEPDGAAQRD